MTAPATGDEDDVETRHALLIVLLNDYAPEDSGRLKLLGGSADNTKPSLNLVVENNLRRSVSPKRFKGFRAQSDVSTVEVGIMALYKNAQILVQSNDASFDNTYEPGEHSPYSGIYRCEGCGREITHIGTTTLPPQDHHQHTPIQGSILWKMVVYPQTK